jgi:hypothetical protein
VAFRCAAILVLAIAASGCVSSQSKKCGDVICPAGHACASDHCVVQSVLIACVGLSEAESCILPQIGTGSCQSGLCVVGRCGDGTVNAIEACDKRDFGGKTCLDFGSSFPEGLKCTADCSLDKSGCVGYCGDGRRQLPEQCDGMDFAGKTCLTEGFYEGSVVCTKDCTLNTGSCAGKCGDGKRNSFNEQCDGDDLAGSSCLARGYHGQVTPLQCSSTCAIGEMSCTCGDDRCAKDTETCVQRDGIFSCVARQP